MIYYDRITQEFIDSLRTGASRGRLLIQPLDHSENAVGEIGAELIGADSRLTVSKGSGCRRCIDLQLLNTDGRFSPSKDSVFWYSRKLRLIAEYTVSENIYRFSQGVFVSREARQQNKQITLTAADKFSDLNGENRIGAVTDPFSTDISSGTVYVAELIRETLLRDNGGGRPIDPVPPMIDPYFYKIPLYADISLSVGHFYGEIITVLADMYGADTYYNAAGHLVFERCPTYDRPYWYMHIGHKWRFVENDPTVQQSTQAATHSFDGVNCVTVSSETAENGTVSYTARNENAESPVNVAAVGVRYNDPPIVYIAAGDTAQSSVKDKCREYAQYLLLQKTRDSITEEFGTVFLPHLDVDDLIFYRNCDRVIDSISVNAADMTMSVHASSVAFLPMNWSVEHG